LLQAALEARGHAVRAAVWDDPSVHWGAFDAVILRSTWDYHKRVAEFAAWLDARQADGSRVWNPPALVRQNIHKGYLLDLAARGVPIVPTELVREPGTLAEIRARRGRSSVVVKPAVGATAFHTAVDPDEETFAALAAEGDVLVQPFLEEVVRDGEWSLIFFGGTFSHAVLKRPRAGDFRVQNDFGGSSVLTVPSAELVAEAARVLEAIDGRWLYARVDGVVVNGTFLLMELELTEPSLFLELDDTAVARFAEAISGWA
jgi:glutathione synthase/RimK-type ligase-like ATP-grasp enzyme